MPRFRHLHDPLFLTGWLAYGINRCLIKPQAAPGFMMFHFNDLWLIPCALPPVLWLHQRLGLRPQDAPPQPGEIAGHLVFWSLLFEWIIPQVTHAEGDPADVAAYAAGAVIAGVWWHRHTGTRSSVAGTELIETVEDQDHAPHRRTFTHLPTFRPHSFLRVITVTTRMKKHMTTEKSGNCRAAGRL